MNFLNNVKISAKFSVILIFCVVIPFLLANTVIFVTGYNKCVVMARLETEKCATEIQNKIIESENKLSDVCEKSDALKLLSVSNESIPNAYKTYAKLCVIAEENSGIRFAAENTGIPDNDIVSDIIPVDAISVDNASLTLTRNFNKNNIAVLATADISDVLTKYGAAIGDKPTGSVFESVINAREHSFYISKIDKFNLFDYLGAPDIQYLIILAVINLILPILIIILTRTSILRRIGLLQHHLEYVSLENYELIEDNDSNDEITDLVVHYNNMVKKIEEQYFQIYRKNEETRLLELSTKQAELNALLSQVNPHFLYNTLECIYMRSIIKGEKETAAIILKLSQLMRSMSRWNQDKVSIKQEIDFVSKYFSKQKYRFGDELSYEINADESCLDFEIPKLSIVSFAENACVHGIEKSTEKGAVKIDVIKQGDKIIIIIGDNGNGISAEKLEELNTTLGSADINSLKNARGTGILNAYIRLKTSFESSGFDFDISSEAGKGTTVTITINQPTGGENDV